MIIPFVKAHGARNDFLLTWREALPAIPDSQIESLAIAICDRNTGAGADGWLLMSKPEPGSNSHAAIELWNSDGSRSEISGNGTRCAAALLVESGLAAQNDDQIRIATGAGLKHLRLLGRQGLEFQLEMNMGQARIEELNASVQGHDATILNVGNPQCALFVKNFDFAWQSQGAVIERLPRFPNRTNVSFVRVLDSHTLDVRFFERGAGETMSSGTGSTGAAAAAMARGLVSSPVEIRTPAGPLQLRWEYDDILLAGPAEIVVKGEFYAPE
jgi:diaminopimelate epimerase